MSESRAIFPNIWNEQEIKNYIDLQFFNEKILYPCLHANDSVDEKEHDNEQGDVWQGLERLDERPKQRSDAFASAQQLHQSHHTKQAEEVDGNEVCARLQVGAPDQSRCILM